MLTTFGNGFAVRSAFCDQGVIFLRKPDKQKGNPSVSALSSSRPPLDPYKGRDF
jgi:hypothetical protein